MPFFLNSKNEVRSGWKFGLYVLFFLLLWFATALTIGSIAARYTGIQLGDQLAILALNEIALFVPAVGAMWLTVRFVDHRPLRSFGIGFVPRWRHDFLFGLAVAAGMLAIVMGASYAFGYVNMRWTAGQVAAGSLLMTFAVLVLGALNEELVFRGFPLQVLVEGLGQWPAMIALSLLFGIVHLNNPNASLLGVINTVVAGILLSLAYVRTRSLWMPYAIHLGWNGGLGFVFGFALSGLDLASLWTTGTAGSETILGGGYGPEGGLIGTFVFAAAAVIVNRHGRNHTSEVVAGSPSRRVDRS